MIGRRRFLGGSVGYGAAIAGAGALGLEVGCGSTNNENVWPIGAYLSLTGGDAQFGIDTKQGIEILFEEINAAGGIKDKKLKLITEDVKSEPSAVNLKVTQLCDRDKVVALLGEIASSLSKPGGIIATQKKVPMITPSSTNAEVTKVGEYVFRVCFLDEFQGRFGAEFCVKTLGKKKIGVMYAENDLYSQGLAEEFKKAVKDLGGEIVVEKKFTKDEMSFTTYVREVKAASPELIYAPIYYKQMVQIGRQAKAEGITPDMFVGGDGWSGDETLLKEMEGAHFTDHHAPDLPWEPSKKFVAAYEAKHKKKPSSLAAMGYDAAAVLADSIKRAKTDNAQGIRDAIAETKNFPGVSGMITINSERNADKPIVVVQVKNGSTAFKVAFGPGAEALLGGAKPAVPSATPSAEPVLSAEPSASAAASADAPASAAPSASAAPAASAAPKK